MSDQTAYPEALRSLAFGSISGSYAALGTAFSNAIRIMVLTNDTNGDLLFSLDGVNDHLFLVNGTFRLYDFNINRVRNDNNWILPEGTQVYVKQSTAPSSGSVYLECLYA